MLTPEQYLLIGSLLYAVPTKQLTQDVILDEKGRACSLGHLALAAGIPADELLAWNATYTDEDVLDALYHEYDAAMQAAYGLPEEYRRVIALATDAATTTRQIPHAVMEVLYDCVDFSAGGR